MALVSVDDTTTTSARSWVPHQGGHAMRNVRLAYVAVGEPLIDSVVEMSGILRDDHFMAASIAVPMAGFGTGTVDDLKIGDIVNLGAVRPFEARLISFEIGTTFVHEDTLVDYDTLGHAHKLERSESLHDVPIGLGKLGGQNRDWLLSRLSNISRTLSDRLDQLRKLGPDWDGYGAIPLTREAIETTTFLLLLTLRLSKSTLGTPFVAPLPDGGLEIEWESPTKAELMMIIPPSGIDVRYLLDEIGESDEICESEGVIPRDASISELIDRLTG